MKQEQECITNNQIVEYLFSDNKNLFNKNIKFLPSNEGKKFLSEYKSHLKTCPICYGKIKRLRAARLFSQVIKDDIENPKTKEELALIINCLEKQTSVDFNEVDFFELYAIIEEYLKKSSFNDQKTNTYTNVINFNTLSLNNRKIR